MKNVAKFLKVSLGVCLIIVTASFLTSCGYISEEEREAADKQRASSSPAPALYEDIQSGAASVQPSNQVSEAPAALVDDYNGDVVKPDGSYVWTQKFVESNTASTPAITAETAVIVIGSDGRGTLNEFIPCRMNGDELFIEYPWGDKGNTSTSGSLKITIINGTKHLEGDVKTSNPDGFYVIDHWIMDEK